MSLVVNSAGGGDPAPPVGPAGGDLTGNYPAPQIAPGVITDADVNAANIDGLVGVPSLRTLGTGGQQAAQGSHTHSVADASDTVKGVTKLSVAAASPTAPIAVGDNDVRVTADQVVAQASIRTLGTGGQQAAAGNHTHSVTVPDASTSVKGVVTLSAAPASPTSPIAVGDNDTRMTNSRAPSGSAGGSLAGTYPNPTIAAGAVTVTELASSAVTAAKIDGTLKPTGSAAAGTEALRALGTTASTAAAGNDSRLSDSRAPTAHATTHQPGGTDAMAVDAAAGTGSLRTIGTGALQATAGNDSRLSDSRAPNGTAGGSLAGTYPNPTIASSASLPGSPTTTTQTAADNSTKVATTAYADRMVPKSTVTAKGDLIGGTASATVAALAVGSNTQVLTADSTQTTGMKWAAPGAAAAAHGTSVPGSPVDGQQYVYQASAEASWQLMYDATPGRWRVIGGEPLTVVDQSADQPNSATYVDTSHVVSLTAPIAGTYVARYEAVALFQGGTNVFLATSVKLGSAATSDNDAIYMQETSLTEYTAGAFATQPTALAASAVVKLQSRTAGSGTLGTYVRRRLQLMPTTIT